ncbi:MAG: hypothetical protein AAGC47_14285, partial [Bacteroidota bacterium]
MTLVSRGIVILVPPFEITIHHMNVFIIGTGLIGGSFSLDIQEAYPEAAIFGIDQNPEHLA